jgi:hypothetical protein
LPHITEPIAAATPARNGSVVVAAPSAERSPTATSVIPLATR